MQPPFLYLPSIVFNSFSAAIKKARSGAGHKEPTKTHIKTIVKQYGEGGGVTDRRPELPPAM